MEGKKIVKFLHLSVMANMFQCNFYKKISPHKADDLYFYDNK